MTISVILPNYNYKQYIKSRIAEVLAQTSPVSEIIFLDDNSTDGSQEILLTEIEKLKQDHPEITVKYSFNQINSGNVFSQWQKGISMASGDYIWIAEMDDSTKPSFVEEVSKGFSDDKTVISYSNSKMIGDNGKPLLKDNLRRVKDVFRKKHSLGSFVVDGTEEVNNNLGVFNSIPNVSAVMFKNQPRLVPFLEEARMYKLCGDWYFYLKVAETGKIAYCNKALNFHRVHQKSVTNTTSLADRFRETHMIHEYVKKNFQLEKSTLDRINKIELNLAKKWKIKDN